MHNNKKLSWLVNSRTLQWNTQGLVRSLLTLQRPINKRALGKKTLKKAFTSETKRCLYNSSWIIYTIHCLLSSPASPESIPTHRQQAFLIAKATNNHERFHDQNHDLNFAKSDTKAKKHDHNTAKTWYKSSKHFTLRINQHVCDERAQANEES